MKLRILDGDSDMGEEINKIVKESGITVRNVVFPIENVYFVKMSDFGVISKEDNKAHFECGNIVDSINILIEQGMKDDIIIMDFSDIGSLSESFLIAYTKLLLNTSAKIISINMNVSVYRNFSSFIEGNMIEAEE